MTSLVVSVTFVILTLAANQLGPRLISTFIGDRQIQTVLGLFLGTILYVLVVLRSLDETLGVEGVPHVAVTIGSVLTVVCLFALLFYVHKIARAIIADSIVARVAGDLHNDIRSMLSAEPKETERAIPGITKPRAGSVSLDRSGYIQVIDYDRLATLACGEYAVFDVKVRAGHFVLKNGEHVVVHAGHPLGAETAQTVRSAFDAIRQAGQEIPPVLIRMADVLGQLAPVLRSGQAQAAVAQHLGKLAETTTEARLAPSDRTAVLRRIEQARVATATRPKEGSIHVL